MAGEDRIDLTVTATTAQMRAEYALAEARARALRAEVKSLSEQMVAAGATSDKALGAALAAAAAESAQAEARVKQLGSALQGAGTAATQMHGSISTATREFRALFDELSSGRTRYTPGTLAIIAQRVFNIGPAALAATGAVAGLVGTFAYLAIEMQRAADAAQAGQAAFAFKGIDVSNEELQQLSQRLFNMKGSSEAATEAVLRSFSSIQGGTSSLREDLVALIPAFEKATGDNVQKAGEKLAGIFADLGKNGKAFLESLNQTPTVTAALNDFNAAMARGDVATAERIVLGQLQEALDRVNKTTEESTGFWNRFSNALIQGSGNANAITEAFKKEAQALKDLNAEAAKNPTTRPQTAESRDKFMADLAGMRDDVSKTQAQITAEEVTAYNRRIAELKKFGLDYTQEERERNALVAQAARQGGENAVQVTRQNISQLMADESRSRVQQLEESVAAWNRLIASHKLTADQQIEVERAKNQAIAELQRAQHEQEQGIAKADADAQMQISRIRLQGEMANLETDFAAHRINADQKYETAVRLTKSLADLDIQQLENEKAAAAASPVAYEEAANKIKIIREQLNTELLKLGHDHLIDAQKTDQQEAQSWRGVVSEIENAESGMVRNLLSRRQSFAQSALQIAGNLLQQEIANDLKGITARLLLHRQEQTTEKELSAGGYLYHLLFENQKTAATATNETAQVAAVTAGEQAKVAAKVAGAAESHAITAAAGGSEVMADAAKGAAGAYSALAGIPIVGPVLGAIAAGVVFSAIAAYEGLASSAGGDWDVSSTRLNLVHPHETIMPASVAGPMRDFFNGGGEGGSGDIHIHGPLVQAIDTRTGMEFIQDHIENIARGLAGQIRIGNQTLRSAVKQV